MQEGEERQDRETALDHFLTSIFSSVTAVFLSTCDIHLNHSSEKYNSISLGQAGGTFVEEINYHAAQH